jgi:ATP-dependent helicase/nuclease subunit B
VAAIVQASQFAQLGIEQARALHPIAESKNPMPTRHFLRSSDTLSQQVAQHLSGMETAGTLLIAPTGGAARRIVQLLEASGKKAPATAQPMQALLPERDDMATPVERCLAWAEALRRLPQQHLQTLFWKETPQTTAELLKAGRNFNKLCDQLTEAGLEPATLQLPDTLQGSFDEGRWAAITALHQIYIARLDRWSLRDPNGLRLEQIHTPDTRVSRLVIAAVPDLPRAFERYAEQLEQGGANVDILIWNPTDAALDDFDTWGRPHPELWNERLIDLSEGQIHVAATAQDEARSAVASAVKSQTCLVAADPNSNTLLASEISSHGRKPYLPEGEALIACQAAKLALGWEEFRQSQDLRSLRRLLELPAFCRALDTEDHLSQTDALIAIDHLLGKTIAATLEAAWLASLALANEAPSPHTTIRPKIRRLLDTVRARLHTSALDLLEIAFPESPRRSSAAERVIRIGRSLENSPALIEWRKDAGGDQLPVQIFAQAIRSERLQTPAHEDAITLNGWLEAPWLTDERLVLCGLIEGRLPQSLDGDPFLPDSIRPALGLSHNAQRLARDAYLLASLAAAHPGEHLRLLYSKYNSEGDPNKPSRLLLRTPLEALPARVRHVTKASASERARPRRQTDWRWQLPGELPTVDKISPTQFEAYLACPFRFCLEKVMGYKSAPEASHEMDAAVFGNLIHKTLENFGLEVIPTGKAMLQLDESAIRKRTQQLLEQEAKAQFGAQPAPAVQVQLASASARLNAFARIQAECFAEGWQILEVERKLDADGDHPLTIGSLKLSGIIDRIEQHSVTGALRVMDYKTFSAVKTPAQTHFAPESHNWLPAALIDRSAAGDSRPPAVQEGGRLSPNAAGSKLKNKTWKNLQLPLYRKILEHWYPGECAAHAPETAYFVLPSDPNESGIYPFDELAETMNPHAYTAALACAEAVAQQITDGVFWPPQPFRGSWDDPLAPLFVNGAPEECIAAETIEKLKGGKP